MEEIKDSKDLAIILNDMIEREEGASKPFFIDTQLMYKGNVIDVSVSGVCGCYADDFFNEEPAEETITVESLIIVDHNQEYVLDFDALTLNHEFEEILL